MDNIINEINKYAPISGSAYKIMKNSIIELETYRSEHIIDYYKGILDKDELDWYLNKNTMNRYYLNH